jgi:hypothetical protein
MTTDDDRPMNDETPLPPTTPPGTGAPDGDDELVSAVLDGEASPGEVERVTSDPALGARLGELRAVADRVAAPVTPHASLDDLLGAALAVAEATLPSETSASSASPAPEDGPGSWVADVVTLDTARRKRERARRLLAVAAVVALMALAVPLLGSLRGDTDSSETADRFSPVGSAINGADEESAPADAEAGDADGGTASGDGSGAGSATASDSAAEAGPSTTMAAAPATEPPTSFALTSGLGALGDFPDAGSLVVAVREVSAAGIAELDTDTAARTSDPACDALAAGLDPAGTTLTSGTATLAGAPVVVLVVAPVDPARGATVVIADPACTTVLDRLPLEG